MVHDPNSAKTMVMCALVAGVLVTLFSFALDKDDENSKANRPLKMRVTANQDAGAHDVEVSNPSTSAYRVVTATFYVEQTLTDPHAGALIEVDTIIFTAADYLPDAKAYCKSISNLKIPAKDEATLRVFIVDPTDKNWGYMGRLVVEYRDADRQKTFDVENHFVLVVPNESSIP